MTDDQMAELKKNILESLIEREVLFQQSQKAGIQITGKMVDERVAGINMRCADVTEFKSG